MAWGSYSAKFDKPSPSERIWVTTHPTCIPIIEKSEAEGSY